MIERWSRRRQTDTRSRVRRALVILGLALSGCASVEAPAPVACIDLTGTYENQSDGGGPLLGPLFFGHDERETQIDITSRDASTLTVSTPRRSTVLAIDRDFVCSAEGIRLTKTDTRNIRLPPLIVEQEIFHYVFAKAADGSLRMTEQVESKGTSFGIPIATGQKQPRNQYRWRAAAPR